MKSIRTRYYGATNTKPSKIIATDHDGNKLARNYDHGLSLDDNHKDACKALRLKMNWKGDTVVGWFGNDAYHTFVTPDDRLTPETLVMLKNVNAAFQFLARRISHIPGMDKDQLVMSLSVLIALQDH